MSPLLGFAGGALFGCLVAWLMIRRINSALRDRGPYCDRCDKPTDRPHLWQAARTYRHCASCEVEVTAILLEYPTIAPDYPRRAL